MQAYYLIYIYKIIQDNKNQSFQSYLQESYKQL